MLQAMAAHNLQPTSTAAHLMPDMSQLPGHSGPTVCIEIKPKAGFVPGTLGIHPDNRVKHRCSRYQLHQQLKLQQACAAFARIP